MANNKPTQQQQQQKPIITKKVPIVKPVTTNTGNESPIKHNTLPNNQLF